MEHGLHLLIEEMAQKVNILWEEREEKNKKTINKDTKRENLDV